MVAYLRRDVSEVGVAVMLSSIGVRLDGKHVCWSSLSGLEGEPPRTVRVGIGFDWLFRGLLGDVEGIDWTRSITFAPDSRHLVVHTKRQLLVFDVATGRCRGPIWGADRVLDPVWLSAEELGWWERRGGGIFTRPRWRVCREKVTAACARRRLVYQAHEACDDARAVWSPDARYLLVAPGQGRPCRLIDVSTGQVRSVEPIAGEVTGIAWKQDASAALIAVRHPGERGDGERAGTQSGVVNEFLLLRPASEEEVRWEEGPYPCPGDEAPRYSLARCWTPDGRYAIGNTATAVVLIDPVNKKSLSPIPICYQALEDWLAGSGVFEPLPVEGWLWTRPYYHTAFGLDYRTGRLVEMPTGEAWAVSPDGRTLAVADAVKDVEATVTMRPLQSVLAAQPTDEATAAGRPY